MEKELTRLVKESPINEMNLSRERKKELIHRIKYNQQSRRFLVTKPILAPLLSFLFVAASLSLFFYLGASEIGLNKGSITDSGMPLYEVTIEKPNALGEKYKFPTKLPFKAKEVISKPLEKFPNTDGNSPMSVYSVTFTGEDQQSLRVVFTNFGSDASNIQQAGDEIKQGEFTGYYRQSQLVKENDDIKFKTSSLQWLEQGNLHYDLNYKPGKSNVMLYENELLRIAQSFR
ncbi:MAG: hypothetical protein ACQEUT_02990 [Bacillota bacterium]